MESKRIAVTIVGTRPLLMHRFHVENDNKKLKLGKRPDAEEEARIGLYENENGPFIPALNMLAAIREAARDAYVEGRGKKTYKEFVQSGLLIHPDEIPLISESGWKIDLRHVRVRASRIVRARPRFDDWKLNFEIEILDVETLPWDKVQLLLERAGRYKGIGDFRPFFGLFTIEKFELAK